MLALGGVDVGHGQWRDGLSALALVKLLIDVHGGEHGK